MFRLKSCDIGRDLRVFYYLSSGFIGKIILSFKCKFTLILESFLKILLSRQGELKRSSKNVHPKESSFDQIDEFVAAKRVSKFIQIVVSAIFYQRLLVMVFKALVSFHYILIRAFIIFHSFFIHKVISFTRWLYTVLYVSHRMNCLRSLIKNWGVRRKTNTIPHECKTDTSHIYNLMKK